MTDDQVFRALIDRHRDELRLHAYRITGSLQDAEDVLQETLLAAWRGRSEERASERAWLYAIATNRSLDALRARRRRGELEPYPDVLLPDESPGPAARYEAKEATALAFVAGLQHLEPQQRVVLVLRDVLGFRASEVAAMLETTESSVNNRLRRARAAFDERLPVTARDRAPLPDSKHERALLDRFADAVDAGDVDGMVALLTDDAWLTMPPDPAAFQGAADIGAFLREREARRGARLRLVPTRANGQPAFATYVRGEPWSLFVLELRGDRISAITWFRDTDLFTRFALPPT